MKAKRYSRAHARMGFTIVELLIVVVVIAILAAITVVAYNGVTNQANDASIKSTLTSMQKDILMADIEGQVPDSDGASVPIHESLLARLTAKNTTSLSDTERYPALMQVTKYGDWGWSDEHGAYVQLAPTLRYSVYMKSKSGAVFALTSSGMGRNSFSVDAVDEGWLLEQYQWQLWNIESEMTSLDIGRRANPQSACSEPETLEYLELEVADCPDYVDYFTNLAAVFDSATPIATCEALMPDWEYGCSDAESYIDRRMTRALLIPQYKQQIASLEAGRYENNMWDVDVRYNEQIDQRVLYTSYVVQEFVDSLWYAYDREQGEWIPAGTPPTN